MKTAICILVALSTLSLGAATRPDTTTHTMPLNASLVTSSQLNDKQMSNPIEAINGRVAGMTVQRSGNGVAAMSAVRLRGTTSLTGGNDPLIIIDGVFGDMSTLQSVNPTDIESFNVLKDAGQTAQYGSRGASGVIEVTTKKGVAGRATITYNGNVGFAMPGSNLKMLDANGYREAVTSAGLMLIDKGYNTDWQREIERTALLHDHHVAFSGGNNSAGYRVSLAYMDHQGIVLHERLRNFTGNMSMYQQMFGDLLRIDVGMFGNVEKQQTAIFDTQKTFYSAHTFNPTFKPALNDAGSWDGFAYANQISHPLALMDSRTGLKTSHLGAHARLTFKLDRHWTLTAFGAYSHNEVETSQYLPTYIWAHGQAYRGSDKTEQWLGNITADYKVTLGAHKLSLHALAEAQRQTLTGFHVTTTNFTDNSIGYDAIQAGALTQWDGTASYREVPSQVAFMARASWDYSDRYSLSAGVRADGSSKFGRGNRWGLFPSVNATWNVLAEQWMMSARNVLEDLKVRAGFGIAGNQGGIDNYLTMSTLQPAGIAPVGNDAAVNMATLRNANPDLKWEIKRTFNAGIDVALWHGRLLASVDVYTSRTTDMLYMYNVGVPPFSYNKLLANLGEMTNRGVEISLGITPITRRDLELNINANVAYQANRLVSLSGYHNGYYLEVPTYVDIANLNGAGFHGGNNHITYQAIGEPLGVFYLPHCTGLESDGEGGYTYKLVDGGARKVCGQAMPKVLLGSNISVRYRHCDLSLQINGAFGHKIFNGTALTYMNMNSLPGYNVLAAAPGRAIKDQTVSDYWLERGDYVNFDYVTVGWNIPLKGRAAGTISLLRLAATVNNLATITGYSGLTPMINSSNVNSTLGLDDKNIYPVCRTFTLSVTVTF